MDLPDVETCETWILCTYHRIRTQGVDRRPDDIVPVDHATGVPLDGSLLKAKHHGVRGIELTLATPVEPPHWASCFLRLTDKPKSQWTEEELWAHDELTHKIKLALHRMSERGLFDLRPANPYDGTPMAFGKDGLTIYAKPTYKVLEESKKVAEKHPRLARGPVNALADAPDHIVQAAPDWYRKMYELEKAKGAN